MDNLDSITKAISDRTLLQRVESAKTSHAQGPNAPLAVELVEWLWQIMGSMYGHKWVSSYGAEVDPDKVWASCLKGITHEQIKHGLNRCALECQEWPPSAPEFRALCVDWSEGKETDWEHRRVQRADAEREQPLRLENKTAREEQRAKNKARMAALREELGI